MALNLNEDEASLDAYFRSELTQMERDSEVERILKAFKLNPYDIIGIKVDATDRFIFNCLIV
jgi:DnaJ family protein C protein 8